MAVLLWLCVIWLPTVLYCPLKPSPPVFCTLIVIDRAVIAFVLLIFTPSSSKNGPLELITVVTVTPPFPFPAVVTVKLTELLALPPTDTVTLTAPAAILGTVTVREVAVAAVTVAVAEPNVTVLAFAVVLKFVPVMVTDVPGVAEFGLMDVIVGADEPPPLTVKLMALLAEPPTETVTLTVPAATLGTVTVREVVVAAVTVAVAEPKLTVLELAVVLKFVPLMVTDAPAAADVGLIDVIVGAVEPPEPPNWN